MLSYLIYDAVGQYGMMRRLSSRCGLCVSYNRKFTNNMIIYVSYNRKFTNSLFIYVKELVE